MIVFEIESFVKQIQYLRDESRIFFFIYFVKQMPHNISTAKYGFVPSWTLLTHMVPHHQNIDKSTLRVMLIIVFAINGNLNV